ncbi:RsmB/NOP family class I SAM-dependent RNA methyltransferase [Corynebacterium antarcticum]|uniref:RsmB/NOP family class I SAM-dependent RNA methyltransferase n=1 Tax=Corynebacterium antarcticum TaxID=2800405 RepID=UPI002002E12D|nr:transcription antitermination factor NusB [Corynebacterium antarcticum]MCK7660421.1 MFS transporter [Corynebacterium antarcticum]
MSLEKSGGFRARSGSGRNSSRATDGGAGTQRRTGGGAGKRGRTQSSNRPRGDVVGTRAGSTKKTAPGGSVRPLTAEVDAPRAAALHVLRAVRADDAYANLILPGLLRTHGITERDAAFATELTYGTLRQLGVLDEVIDAASSRPLETIDGEVLDILRLSAYQLLNMRVGAHAAVDTGVRLTEGIGQERAKGFVNAVLRTISRRSPDEWMSELAPAGGVAATAFANAHPVWIAESFARVLGETELDEALAADSERPKVHLAARPGEITAEELALATGGEPGPYSPYAVHLDSGDPGDLEPLRERLATVQDEGSQIIARAVVEAPVEGTDRGRWLDLCAGPGGKAALIGALARIDGARVDAVEVSEHRAKLVRTATSGLPVNVITADGRDPGLEPGYDRVLVDAPCSGLGALRRRPEARWRKSEADIAELTELQFELLSSAVSLVRSGGVVVYSTCSPDLRETRGVVDRALTELGVTELDATGLACGMADTGEHVSVQMWPHRHGTDAMFFSVLRVGRD